MSAIYTARLTLVPLTRERADAAMRGRDALAALLRARVSEDWPQPDFADYLPYLARDLAANPALAEWIRLVVHTADRMLIGGLGTTGPPDEAGTVEIGYDVVTPYRRQGYAFEAARGFVDWLFAQPGVARVTAECLADNVASVRVLEKLGMRRLAPDGEMLRWELVKPQ